MRETILEQPNSGVVYLKKKFGSTSSGHLNWFLYLWRS